MRMVPWRDWDEWLEVYAMLFSRDPTRQREGIHKVQMWKARGHLPHSVESTSQLVQVR